MDRRVINLYDTFTHGGMSRRDFLDRLTGLTGSAAAAAAILPLLRNNYAQAAIVAADDPRLVAERVAYDSPKGKINGYLVRPTAKGRRPAIIVIQENRGLNPHIEDIARRLAVEGFLVLAPDLLSVPGGTPPDEDKARELHAKTDPKDITAAAVAAVPFLLTHPESNGNVGVVAFASAAALPTAWRRKGQSSKPWWFIMGCRSPRIRCRPFVGRYCCTTPSSTNVLTRASLLLVSAKGKRKQQAASSKQQAASSKQQAASSKQYKIYMYPGVNHAFNNDTGGARYNKEAADLAWDRTLAFFKENLGAPLRPK